MQNALQALPKTPTPQHGRKGSKTHDKFGMNGVKFDYAKKVFSLVWFLICNTCVSRGSPSLAQ